MKISVVAHPKAKKIQVLKKSDAQYEVWVREAPDKGRANEAIVEVISHHLGIPKWRVRIVRGLAARRKIVEIIH